MSTKRIRRPRPARQPKARAGRRPLTESLLRDIAAGVAASVGEDFFRSLALYLAKTLGAELAFVGRLTDAGRGIETISMCHKGRIIANLRYALAGTPCELVVRKQGPGIYPRDLQRLFPEDRPSAEMNLQSYAGASLRSAAGEVLGIVAVMDTRPLQDTRLALRLLEIFASRAAAELERLRAEEALRESEGNLRALTENANVGILVNRGGRHVFANPRALTMFGYTLDEIRHTGVRELVHPDEYEKVSRRFRERQAGKPVPPVYETVFMTRDGKPVPVEITVALTLWQGEPAGLVFVEDITERKRAERALRESERNLARAQEVARIGSWAWDIPGNRVVWSEETYRLFGTRPEAEIDVWAVIERSVHPDDKPRLYDTIRASAHDGARRPIKFRLRLPDGTERVIDAQGEAELDAAGRPLRMFGTMQDVTAREYAEQSLRDSELRFRRFFEVAFEGIAIHDKGIILDANETLARMFGYELSEFIGRNALELTAPESRELLKKNMLAGVEEPYEAIGLRKDGTRFTAEIVGRPVQYQGRPARVVSIRDISERKRSEDMLRRLGRILDDSSNEIYVFDAETLRFVQVNHGARQNLGYTMDELRRLTPLDLKPEYTHEGFAQLVAPLRDGSRDMVAFETVHRRKDGSRYPVEVRLQLSRTETPPVFVAIIQDITERMQTRERLQHLAQHDVLTELPNRALLLDRLRQSLARARWQQRMVAVLFIDLDRFKTINDTLGHEAGDRVLQQLSGRFNRSVREGDTVARFGGDEFVILLDDVASGQDVGRVAQKVLDALAAPFTVDDQSLYITASIGISLFPADGEESGTLLKNADIAMYRSKELGKNTYQFYSADMSARAFERLSLETSLRRALERNEFVLHYQPQIEVDSGAIIGVEALIRWQHPDFGLVAPAEFIPLLEETGLIVPTGEWLLGEACRQLRAWHAAGRTKLRLAVNLSPRQVQAPGLIAMVEQAVDGLRGEPAWLELEITEGLLVKHAPDLIDKLEALRALGVRLAVDDFGTGYSSLSYLRRFPIDTLKIDRSFVQDIPHDPDDSAITTAIVAMAQSLRLEAIAEGVENIAQRDFLRSRGCRLMQGFLFSKPLPVDEVTRLLRSGAVSPDSP